MKAYSTLTPEQEAAWWDAAERGLLRQHLESRGNIDTMAYVRQQIAEGGGVDLAGRGRGMRQREIAAPATADYEGRDQYKEHLNQLFA